MMLDYIANLRRMIGNTKIVIPGVRALIFDEEGSLLLGKERSFDCWALPHGCVDVGESAYGALCREVREETALEIREADLFGVYTDPKHSVVYPNGDRVQTFTVAFLVRAWEGEPRPDRNEVTELGFFMLDNLPEPIYPVHADTIEDYRTYDGRAIAK